MSMNGRLAFAIVAAALGSGFQHGYHTGVINVPSDVVIAWINETRAKHHDHLDSTKLTLLWSVTTSMLNAGGTVGGLLSGLVAFYWGPRLGLILNNILVAAATLLMVFSYKADSLEMLVVGRFVVGMNGGLNAGLCPMYLSEIAPVKLRGAIGSVYQLVIVISIMCAMIFGLGALLGHKGRWPYLFVIPATIMFIQVIMLPFCPESPRWLLAKKNDETKATKALTWLRGGDADVVSEMGEMKAADAAVKAVPKVTLKDMFKKKSLRRPLIISLGIMCAQQLSGINAVIFYSTNMFIGAGIAPDSAKYATIGLGVVNLIMTIISMLLVEIAGRKTLLMVAFGGMAVDTALMMFVVLFQKDGGPALSYFAIVLLVIYIILFATGAGSIPWFIVTELFNQSARPTAVSLAVPTNWIFNLMVTLLFPLLNNAMGGFVFLIFTAFNVIFLIFIIFLVPETKNKTIEEITAKFPD